MSKWNWTFIVLFIDQLGPFGCCVSVCVAPALPARVLYHSKFTSSKRLGNPYLSLTESNSDWSLANLTISAPIMSDFLLTLFNLFYYTPQHRTNTSTRPILSICFLWFASVDLFFINALSTDVYLWQQWNLLTHQHHHRRHHHCSTTFVRDSFGAYDLWQQATQSINDQRVPCWLSMTQTFSRGPIIGFINAWAQFGVCFNTRCLG